MAMDLQAEDGIFDQTNDGAFDQTNTINRIAHNDNAFFKSQQRGDPDLTIEEKCSIVKKLLESEPRKFLERYGKLLTKEDKPCLDALPSNSDLDYRKQKILERLGAEPTLVPTRNRRYKKMMQLIEGGEYFSDVEMKSRDPLTYERMVGKFLDEEELNSQAGVQDMSLSTFYMNHIEAMKNNELYEQQLLEEKCRNASINEEEYEDDDDEEEEDEEFAAAEDEQPRIDRVEKNFLRSEFVDMMKERFLRGEDGELDYKEIDDDEDLDLLEVMEQDAEDKYFDE